eukprot:260700_1
MSYDKNISFMPPPLNVFAAVAFFIFCFFELLINWTCTCTTRNSLFDLSLCGWIMPKCMKTRKLELDDSIVSKEDKYWEINTGEGITNCKITNYNTETKLHTIRFFNEYDEPVNVSVYPHVDEKHEWSLELLNLHEHGLIELTQFEAAVDQDAINEANKKMNSLFWNFAKFKWCT